MANTNRICSVSGCGKSGRLVRGMCQMHYRRWRVHGDPNYSKLSYPRRGEVDTFLEQLLASPPDDECVGWPFQRDKSGRGRVRKSGKGRLASRHVCELYHGAPPSPEHEAAHNCGKAHEGCVNPKHLRWATHRENEADKLLHGTRPFGEGNCQTRLSSEAVQEIRSLKRAVPAALLAGRYGVSRDYIYRIQSGKARILG